MHVKSLMNSSNGTILGTDFFGGRDGKGYEWDRESKAICTIISI